MPTAQHLAQRSQKELRRARALGVGLVVALVVVVASASYEVRPGDTLARIASEHGTTVSALAQANSIANPNLIRVGQVLTISGTATAPATTHTVVLGDTLASIAGRYGTSVSQIAGINGLRNPNRIYVGQLLVIPSTAAPAPPLSGTGTAQDAGGEQPSQEQTAAVAPTTHVVQIGETLAGIARRYGLTVSALAAANGITNTNLVYSGTTLVVSDRPVAPIVATQPTIATHVVGPGDTLAAIAIKYGTTSTDLAQRNALGNPDLIQIGQSLEVPGAGWVCPVTGARYFNDWGFPRSGGRFHQGNDLFAPRGTEIRAPVSGTVTQRTGTIGGLQFWMEGDDGNLYIGTHLDAFGAGGEVRAGDVIGFVGDSGNAVGSSPHVHFEIHAAGSPVNPYPTLQANGC
jgi:LysM repeat protein